jgi:hypothetical protein
MYAMQINGKIQTTRSKKGMKKIFLQNWGLNGLINGQTLWQLDVDDDDDDDDDDAVYWNNPTFIGAGDADKQNL